MNKGNSNLDPDQNIMAKYDSIVKLTFSDFANMTKFIVLGDFHLTSQKNVNFATSEVKKDLNLTTDLLFLGIYDEYIKTPLEGRLQKN